MTAGAPPRRLGALALVGLIGLLPAPLALSGCQSIELNAANAAQLRVIDAAPDAGGIDAYQNNTGLAYNLSYGTMTTYVPMVPGVYALSAAKAGTRQTLAGGNGSLAAGHQYTVVFGNMAAAMQQTLYLDQTQPAPAGEIAVRLIDQAGRAGAVDVYLVEGKGKLAYTAPLVTNLSFGGNSGYLNVPAGVYAVVVAPAGSAPTSSAATLLSGAQSSYAAGAVRTIVLIDAPAGRSSATQQAGTLPPAVEAMVAVDAEADSR